MSSPTLTSASNGINYTSVDFGFSFVGFATDVREPASLALLGIGLFGVGAASRKKRV